MDRLEAARLYIARGWCPLPIPAGTKAPDRKDWVNYTPEPWAVPKDFAGAGNIGLLLGEKSRNLVDIDLDGPEARALADTFLPPTPLVHGRKTAPRSHRWYRCDPLPKTRKFQDIPGGLGMLVEIRVTGAQTVVPWSTHPDTGEAIEWEDPALPEPPTVAPGALHVAVARLAAASLVARHWPTTSGGRHSLALSLSGALVNSGWGAEDVIQFVTAASRSDSEQGDRIRAARDTAAKPPTSRLTGIPTLRLLLPRPVVDRLCDWLSLGEAPPEEKEEKPRQRGPRGLGECLRAIREGRDFGDVVRASAASGVDLDTAREALCAAAGRPAEEFDAEMARLDSTREIPRLDKSDPQKSAVAFLDAYHVTDGIRTLHHYRDDFYSFEGGYYQMVADATIRSSIWDFLPLGTVVPNSSRVSNCVDALRAKAHILPTQEPPCWLGDAPEGYPPADDLIPLRSGLLQPGMGKVFPSTPRFFNLSALPFDYNPEDTVPPGEWLTFLASVWPDEFGSVQTLQEIFGYLLTSDTHLQKMFLMVGPTRSGKGTIARVLRCLLGETNVAGPTLASLAGEFGLQNLLGKGCALIPDARLSRRMDHQIIAERLLAISGEDAIDINRKNQTALTVKLKTRFLFMSNELPRLPDASSALPGRFIILRMTKSFRGEEDLSLFERLRPELPRILNWALAGRERLYERGYFLMPEESKELMQELEDMSSPVKQFVGQTCDVTVDVDDSVGLSVLYSKWLEWCRARGRDHTGTMDTFKADLRTAFPHLPIKEHSSLKFPTVFGIRTRADIAG